jgi:hypothetical protein
VLFILTLIVASILPLSQNVPVAAQDTATYSLFKFECPPGYDPASGDANAAFANCTTVVPGLSFTLQSGDASFLGGTQQTDQNGWTSWSGIPLNSGYSISESLPPGYGDPWVYCDITNNPNNPGDARYDFFRAPGGVMDIGFTAPSLIGYAQSACYWFNVPGNNGSGDLAPAGGGSVTVNKRACPQNVDWQTFGYELLLAECVSRSGNISFDIISGSYANTQTTDSTATATWSNVPYGTLQIVEYPPTGYQVGRIFCSLSSPDVASIPSWDEVFFSDGYYVDLPDGWNLQCYVFNGRAGQADEPGGVVSLTRRLCYPWIVMDDTSIGYFLSGCRTPQPGISFELSRGQYVEERTTDVNGNAFWENVPEGDYELFQRSSPWRVGKVFCGYSLDPDMPLEELELYGPDEEDGTTIEVPNGYFVHCIVFDVGPQTGLLWVTVTVCPQRPDVDEADPFSCPVDYDLEAEIDYQVSRQAAGAQYESVKTVQSGEVLRSDAVWTDAPGGVPLTIRQISNEYELIQASCGMANYGEVDSLEPYPIASDGSITGPWLEADSYTRCEFYSVPTDTEAVPTATAGAGDIVERPSVATLVLEKRTCPAGYDLFDPDADIETDCDELIPDVEFALTSLSETGGEAAKQATGDDGTVTWLNLSAGPYLITETLPEGIHAAFIWTCQSDQRQFQLDNPFTPFAWAGPDGEIGITLTDGETLECAWYDIPSAPSTVTILTFECPAATVIIAQCTPAGAGVEFALNPVGGTIGAIIQLTTDETGSATGSGDPGAYTLSQQGSTPCLIDSESIDDQGQIVIDEGADIELRVYNCEGGG